MKKKSTINVEINSILKDAVERIAIKNNQTTEQCVVYILENYVNEHFFGVNNPSKVCPHCLTIAEKYEDIEKVFGWRTVNNKTIPQSYCKACRKKGVEEKRTEVMASCTSK